MVLKEVLGIIFEKFKRNLTSEVLLYEKIERLEGSDFRK